MAHGWRWGLPGGPHCAWAGLLPGTGSGASGPQLSTMEGSWGHRVAVASVDRCMCAGVKGPAACPGQGWGGLT